jgi:hypothetical protein
VLKRRAQYRGGGRPDMARGCDERLDLEFLKFLRWIWDYPSRSRPKVLELLRENPPGKSIFRLRTRADIESFLRNVG